MSGIAVRLESIRDKLIQLRDLQEEDSKKKIKDLKRAMDAKDIIAAATTGSAGRS